MKQVIVRRGNMFRINQAVLKPAARKPDVCNALYAAIYKEFRGAATNKRYSNLTPVERFNKVNEFALNWLRTRGLE